MDFYDFLRSKDWEITYRSKLAGRVGKTFSCDDLPILSETKSFLEEFYPDGIYKHQKESVRLFKEGNNICLATGTASGKSLVFYTCAIENLYRNRESKVLAVYPLKALGKEQEERWTKAIQTAQLQVEVGRIDGQVPTHERLEILRRSQILVVTPDIIHTWLLSSLSENTVIEFISSISTIILDEVHTYTGVFGSNAAFLFRRLNHLMSLVNRVPQYICASATIREPQIHVENIIGMPVKVIGNDLDTSPKHSVKITLLKMPFLRDLLTDVSELLNFIVLHTSSIFISFVDSRKQTEYIASILSRYQQKEDDRETEIVDQLQGLNVLPYRAGYEEHDRNIIQDRLTNGTLRGVISTSALELGIDIPHLNFGILVGVPRSLTSLYQRIGRIGRHCDGEVIIINTGDIYDEAVFKDPKRLFDRPLAEGALYLENPRIQYIHALCLARPGGEHDQFCKGINLEENEDFSTTVKWPEGFLELCKKERIGEIPRDLRSMKAESGDDPNHSFPLRDVETQFSIELRRGPEFRQLGTISYGQLMREAYPGAVYYYATQPFRVYRINPYQKNIHVRKEKRYTTKPKLLPPLIFPDTSAGNVYQAKTYGDMLVMECTLQIRESISGIKERRGPNELNFDYPINQAELNVVFTSPRFTRNYFTTGVVISHPALDEDYISIEAISNLLFEAFLFLIPFERRDIASGHDKFRVEKSRIKKGSKFVVIYDQTYGSLRLSGRLLEGDLLKKTFNLAKQFAEDKNLISIGNETLLAIQSLCMSLEEEPAHFSFDAEASITGVGDMSVRIICPGSKGLNVFWNNEEFQVEGIFFNPSVNALCYRGRHISNTDMTVKEVIPIYNLKEIPGESVIGIYDLSTGEIKLFDSK